MTEMQDTLRPRLAALMENGAHRFDPARFCYIESLARRAIGKHGAVCRLIERKALAALVDYQHCVDQARSSAADMMARVSSEYPDSTDRARTLFEEGDFTGLQRLAARLRRTTRQSALVTLTDRIEKSGQVLDKKTMPLSFDDLLRRQEDEVLQSVGNSMARNGASTSKDKRELNAFHLFKETCTKLYSDRLVSHAIKERPENAGPLNSQMLVTRSLFAMRQLSPSYLNRFVSYIDTLLWLEQAGEEIKPRTDKKRNRHK